MSTSGHTATEGQIERFVLRVGDVVITKDSETPDDIGVPALIAETAPDLVCGYHLTILRPKADSQFLAYQMSVTAMALAGALAAGVTRPRMNLSLTSARILREENLPGIAISTKNKQFAVIVDEAHSSQSGESAMELKGVLNADRLQEEAAQYVVDQGLDPDDDADHLAGVVREMMKRGKQPNLSFFAFTATPKYKTLNVFDEPGPTGQAPFHLYTMRQAIEEELHHLRGVFSPRPGG